MDLKQADLIKIAADTVEACEEGSYETADSIVDIEEILDDAVICTEYIAPEDEFELDDEPARDTKISLTDETTAVAGRRLAQDGAKVAILNFASARNPGGGWLHGAKAQEEDLCRVSCLYPCLTRPDIEYYDVNIKCKSALYTDAMIYSPDVPFIKDENYQPLEEPFFLSVVTCPAPNLNRSFGTSGAIRPSTIQDGEEVTEKEIKEVFKRRARRVLSVMVIFEHRDIVLGAWGCGAFGNNPTLVATVFKEVLEEKQFQNRFDRVVFAVPNKESSNHKAFAKVFQQE